MSAVVAQPPDSTTAADGRTAHGRRTGAQQKATQQTKGGRFPASSEVPSARDVHRLLACQMWVVLGAWLRATMRPGQP
jgi:hypothetical protein